MTTSASSLSRRSPIPTHLAYLAMLLLVFATGIRSALAETNIGTVRVASGLSMPLYVTTPPGDTSRVFIVEQRGADARGRIKILRAGSILATPFLTTGVLSTGGEQGLLGLAFAPDYATSGRFYINYTDASGTTQIVRHTVSANPDVANPTGTTILSIPQPYPNHNGGWLGFGPDGFLYLATGDGGSAGDPEDRAQNVDSLLGKVLRLDVSGSGYTIPPGNPFVGKPGRDEIYAFGLRNPWRDSFDRLTGDFVIADVGQGSIEEVDFTPAGTGTGKNYGWRCFEGDTPYTTSGTTPCGDCFLQTCSLVFPAYQYPHTLGRCSITGGYIYRGCAIPDLQGQYFFADWCGNQIYSGKLQPDTLLNFRDRTAQLAPGGGLSITGITSFGEDARGEMYIVDGGGEVFKIVPKSPVLESDMPALRAAIALGDTLGSTSPGNALLTGVTPFADAGSRIRGVGYVKDATLRDCTEITGGCLTAKARLGTFDIDLSACVDAPAGTLTRQFVFKNAGGASAPLAYVDVITPKLRNEVNTARRTAPGSGLQTATLVQANSFSPNRWITHSGRASIGGTTSADVDTAADLAARIAADQPLAGGTAAGPANVGMALGFDFGSVAPAQPETVTVTTKITSTAPSGVEETEVTPPRSALRVLSRIPFRTDLRLEMALARDGEVALDVFDPAGRRVRSLARGTLPAGRSLVGWDGKLEGGRPAPSGIYFIKLRAGGESFVQRVVLLR